MALKSGYMRFRHQILLLLLSIILIMMVAAVLVTVPAAFTAQQSITFERLTSVSNLKTLWVMREFNELKRGLVALADNVAVVDEVRFINKLLPLPEGDQELIERIRQVDQGEDLLAGDRLSLYWQSYKRLYANFRYIENSFPGSEVLLIRPEDGLVVFSLLGESRFMERLGRDAAGSPALYQCYQRAVAQPGSVVFEDFSIATGATVPRACAAKAVTLDEEVVAVLVHEFSGELINSIMSLRPGLGETGETYLVGPDKLMRTESRFGGAVSILNQFVDSRAVREGVAGYAGSSTTTNYRGARVFSVWQPIELDAIRWTLIAEIEEDEAFSGLRASTSKLLLFWWLGFLALVFVAYAFARRTERPLLALVRNARRLAEGSYSGSIREEAGSREVRDLVRSFNNMGAQIRERTLAVEAARDRAEQASWEADQASRAKSDFLSKMSHELRTPLNGVLGYSQILKRDNSLAEHQRDTLDAIENCGQHLLELINDVLDISRIESGKLDLDERPADLQALVRRVVDVVKPKALEKGLSFEVDAQALPDAINTDAMRLRQVLINLLGNAIKFTDEGFVRLRASNDAEAKVLTIYIEDSGAGIPEHRLDEIFSPFAQTISGKRAGGAGLGLAISRQLSVALGGDLSVSSELGEGSVFSVRLPYVLADLPAESEPELVDTVTRLPEGKPLHVLVADDNATNRDILVQLLRGAGFTTQEAADGEEALQQLEKHRPHLVLMDIRMPVIDGLTASRQIRENPDNSDIKIIAISATVMPEMQLEIARAGCEAFLPKPVDARLLFAEIEKLFGIEMVEGSAELPTIEQLDDTAEMIGLDHLPAVCRLLENIADAARQGDVSSVRGRISRLRETLGEHNKLVIRLRRYSDNFELDAVSDLAQRKAGEFSGVLDIERNPGNRTTG